MQGKSLWPLLSGQKAETSKHREDVYCESYDANFPHDHRRAWATMVRTERHKLVLYHTDNFGELYDLQADPGENRNVWEDGAYAAVKLELMQSLCNRMAMTVDPLPPRKAPW